MYSEKRAPSKIEPFVAIYRDQKEKYDLGDAYAQIAFSTKVSQLLIL